MNENHSARFDVEPGSLPDMTCGNNGAAFVKVFRPTHFTATWGGGALVEVKVWGPQLLKDHSPGKRQLDHCWKRTRTMHSVKYADLPPLVASTLRSYGIENGLVASSQQPI